MSKRLQLRSGESACKLSSIAASMVMINGAKGRAKGRKDKLIIFLPNALWLK
ncbi:MAG: hypothetical protein F6K36_01710 [Symploca sp. SIO3C6]|nr:hypothetical protein [Symploca sp. SIO3C6]